MYTGYIYNSQTSMYKNVQIVRIPVYNTQTGEISYTQRGEISDTQTNRIHNTHAGINNIHRQEETIYRKVIIQHAGR